MHAGGRFFPVARLRNNRALNGKDCKANMNERKGIQTQLRYRTSMKPVSAFPLQRACACGQHKARSDGECEECQKKRQGTLQRAAVNHAPTTQVPSIVHEVLRSPGQPLNAATRAFMEPRFGHDFSDVRVHTDVKAARSAETINALAYTIGRDVIFGEGQYEPGTSHGKRLIAHELTHVMQQGNQQNLQSTALRIGAPNDMFEHQADQVANAISLALPVRPSAKFDVPTVQRDLARPPHGAPAPLRQLTQAEITAAIDFNQRRFRDPYSIRVIRDIVGLAPTPAIVDEDLINAVVQWQAERNMGQDGMIGHSTTRSLFLELVAEGQMRDAVLLLMDSYGLPESRHLRQVSVGLGAGCCSTPTVPQADAVTANIGAGNDMRICVCRTSIPHTAGGYDHFVRILLHETVHVPQLAAGVDPGSDAGEFEAFFAETCNRGRAPQLTPAQRVNHANIALNHFAAIPPAQQTPVRIAMRDRLNALVAAGGVGPC